MQKKHYTYSIVGAVVIAAGLLGWYYATPGKFDAFGACLAERGAKMYGAFWCGACERQKALFGKSKGTLPDVECSTPDRQGQLPVCIEAGIESYPTWEFADGSRETRVLTLEELSERTGCPLPF